MSAKSRRVADLLAETAVGPSEPHDPRYRAFFRLFNRQKYYEAHEVLEDLWLAPRGDLHSFYKGLIQLAGAWVHLQKGRRPPAARLMRLALKNLEPCGPRIQGLDINALAGRIRLWINQIEDPSVATPYHPENPPQIDMV